MTRPALLDVNVLVGLFDPDHVHHEAAHRWFGGERRYGWGTCPLTENAVLRLLSNPAYTVAQLRPADVAQRLGALRASGQHVFWPDEISLTDERLFDLAHVQGHRQLTDVYLLGLARRVGARLATFDRSIPLRSIRGATEDDRTVIPA